MEEKLTLKAFLSHRYKSPKVNLYFYNLISPLIDIQFEIDAGSLSTNVTRLERMIRESDAFIGIYPIPQEFGLNPNKQDLVKASKYFKLEIDIATRIRKSSIFFIDERYGNFLPIPNSSFVSFYDSQEITSDGGFPNQEYFETIIKSFFDIVRERISYERKLKSHLAPKNKILIFKDSIDYENYLVDDEISTIIKSTVENFFHKDVIISNSPKSINEEFYSILAVSDFVILNVANNQNLTSFIHSFGIPQIRIKTTNFNSNFLYGNFTVGYPKDIIEFSNANNFVHQLKERLFTINATKERINTKEQAIKYFKKASLRKEAVFVSYSGADEEEALKIINLLKTKFSIVFNYRDKAESISPGKPWIEEIFDSLAKSSLGIMLFSETYFKSGNCMHELREIMALRDAHKIMTLPIKLYNDKSLELPSFINDLQYIRYWNYEDKNEILSHAIKLIEENGDQL